MSTPEGYEDSLRRFSNKDLLNIINNPHDYDEDALALCNKEIDRRGGVIAITETQEQEALRLKMESSRQDMKGGVENIIAPCLGLLFIAYLVGGLILAVNPGDVFTNWFSSSSITIRPGITSLNYSLWDSATSGGKCFLTIMFFLPRLSGIFAASLITTASKAMNSIVIILAACAIAFFAFGSIGAATAVSDSLKEIAKFLGFGAGASFISMILYKQ